MSAATDIVEKVIQTTKQKKAAAKKRWISFYKESLTKDGGMRISMNHYNLVKVFKSLGVMSFKSGGQTHIISVKDNVAKIVEQNDVITSFEDWYKSMVVNNQDPNGNSPDYILQKLYAGLASFFSPMLLHRCIPDKPLKFNNHTKEKAFFYYKNGFVEVTKNGIQLKPYSELKGIIWESQILNREYRPAEKSQFSFKDFINNISGNAPDKEGKRKSHDRVKALRTKMGYLLHSYYEYDLYAINFTDSKVDSFSNGRTGKTLLSKALQYMVNNHLKEDTIAVEIGGKDFNPKDRFKYQELEINTRLVILNDLKEGLNLKPFYNDITDGLGMQKKNEGKVQIWVKMLFITNEPIIFEGESDKGRMIEFEFSEFYDSGNRPQNVHGEWFFTDWNGNAWAQFDNFMLESVQLFFQNGVIKAREIHLQERKLLTECGEDFIQWMEDKLHNNEIEHKKEYDKKALKEEFITQYDDHQGISSKKFSSWLHLFAEVRNEFYNAEEGNKAEDVRKGGKSLIKFYLRKPTVQAAQEEIKF